MRWVTMGMLSTLETLTTVAGRGHAAVLQGVDLQGIIKTGRGNVAKKWLRFHSLVKLLSDYQRVTGLPVVASRLAFGMLNSHPQ